MLFSKSRRRDAELTQANRTHGASFEETLSLISSGLIEVEGAVTRYHRLTAAGETELLGCCSSIAPRKTSVTLLPAIAVCAALA